MGKEVEVETEQEPASLRVTQGCRQFKAAEEDKAIEMQVMGGGGVWLGSRRSARRRLPALAVSSQVETAGVQDNILTVLFLPPSFLLPPPSCHLQSPPALDP
eukprot:760790-Hanusia_phi.AAC.1